MSRLNVSAWVGLVGRLFMFGDTQEVLDVIAYFSSFLLMLSALAKLKEPLNAFVPILREMIVCVDKF
jgi:hypothetical protein